MGCASSALLNHDDEFSQIGSSAFSHHIVSLTSTTYGLLTLDPSPSDHRSPTTIPSHRFTLGSVFPPSFSDPPKSDPPEIINSWELMAGLDPTNESFRFSPLPSKPFPFRDHHRHRETSCFTQNPIFPSIRFEKSGEDKENSNPNSEVPILLRKPCSALKSPLDGLEPLCPPGGEDKVVVYTTSLRGVRKTFEECNAVRSAIEGHGVLACERDISMDKGFREELTELMKGKEKSVPPRVFVKGRYVGGADEVIKMAEEGYLGQIFEGLPKLKAGYVCEGCGGVRFLPCSRCSGSCKMVMLVKKESGRKQTVVVRCVDCNENGLVVCPICS